MNVTCNKYSFLYENNNTPTEIEYRIPFKINRLMKTPGSVRIDLAASFCFELLRLRLNRYAAANMTTTRAAEMAKD
jgi:hypothetical protein